MRRIVFVMMLAATGLLTLGGCQEALFPSDQPRTQYERYDRLRGRYTPTERMNEFGRSEPALRARLDPSRQ